jgi:hypothetical protein
VVSEAPGPRAARSRPPFRPQMPVIGRNQELYQYNLGS